MKTQYYLFVTSLVCVVLLTGKTHAHDISSAKDSSVPADFDITQASANSNGNLVTFIIEVAGTAGKQIPEVTGQLPGAMVDAYVWPTSLDPGIVGFDENSGTLALAITSHPDFDDTPLFDENNDGNPANDGKTWHSHWVVLVDEAACGAGLKVRDVSPGQDLLPLTAPGLPIALDSPGMSPSLSGHTARITVPLGKTENIISFDAVTAQLQVNTEGTVPLLCVVGVRDIASSDLSLPGKVIPNEQ